eukprot:GHRQ01036871.1.p2 GENE.GHRQ01036871.1~~GHRQ01036871.1.p2  ORF type:complete len:103 (+),score=18.61 GHRQ01036871.1:538-846(+)
MYNTSLSTRVVTAAAALVHLTLAAVGAKPAAHCTRSSEVLSAGHKQQAVMSSKLLATREEAVTCLHGLLLAASVQQCAVASSPAAGRLPSLGGVHAAPQPAC